MSEQYNRSKRFTQATSTTIGTLNVGGPWRRFILRNNDTVNKIGIGFITQYQDGSDMTSFATAHWDLGPSEVLEVSILATDVKHISNAGTPQLDLMVLV